MLSVQKKLELTARNAITPVSSFPIKALNSSTVLISLEAGPTWLRMYLTIPAVKTELSKHVSFEAHNHNPQSPLSYIHIFLFYTLHIHILHYIPASRGPLYSELSSPFLKIFRVGYPLTENLLQVSFPASVQSTCHRRIT